MHELANESDNRILSSWLLNRTNVATTPKGSEPIRRITYPENLQMTLERIAFAAASTPVYS